MLELLRSLSDLLGGIPIPAVAAIGILAAIQLVVQVVAIVDLARRPAVRHVNKWVWLVIIVAGNLVGAIVYLAIGRGQVAEEAASPASVGSSAADRGRVVGELYGEDERQ